MAHSCCRMTCSCCFIVPPVVLRDLARDENLDPNVRKQLQRTFEETKRLQIIRDGIRAATVRQRTSAREEERRSAIASTTARVHQDLFDCQHRRSLPGRHISRPGSSADEAVKTVYNTTAKVADFYSKVFGRNSVDNEGLDLVSSIHYLRNYDNAFWNGQQMVYGDGDGRVFSEFWRSPDVIGHELTHGVTQFESGLIYEGESGALNESISDVFGAVFNQWLSGWPATNPDGWLIGAGIMAGPAKQAGKTCLRDMLNPGANHCLSPQPGSYENFDATADVHINSGIPNKAFATFARAVGGNSWEKAVKVWYRACTNRRLPSAATFVDFARLTIESAEGLEEQVRAAWQAVDLPLEVV